MAILSNNSLGNVSGKFGNAVGVVSQKRTVLRIYKPFITPNGTLPQTTQRHRFSNISLSYQLFQVWFIYTSPLLQKFENIRNLFIRYYIEFMSVDLKPTPHEAFNNIPLNSRGNGSFGILQSYNPEGNTFDWNFTMYNHPFESGYFFRCIVFNNSNEETEIVDIPIPEFNWNLGIYQHTFTLDTISGFGIYMYNPTLQKCSNILLNTGIGV